jgi:type II secretory pathway component PulJ
VAHAAHPGGFGGFYMHNIFIALMQRSGASWARSLFRLLSSVLSVAPWCHAARGKPRRYALAIHHSSFIIHHSPVAQGKPRRQGFTLVELLVSTVLALVVMFGVVSAFALIGQGVSDSRSTLEMSAQLREVAAMLKNDLGGVTAVMRPPRSPETGEGYFEYTEGPIGAVLRPDVVAQNNDTGQPDTTVGDIDDILMFTMRSRTEPFIGRTLVKRAPRAGETPTGFDNAGGLLPQVRPFVVDRTVESHEAEVIWFVRGRMLYRRVLLVVPQHDGDLRTPEREVYVHPRSYDADPPGTFGQGGGFAEAYDISIRSEMSGGVLRQALTPNSLADLTKPENRYAHRPPHHVPTNKYWPRFPFHPQMCVEYSGPTPVLGCSPWGPRSGSPYDGGPRGIGLGLPTLSEWVCLGSFFSNPAPFSLPWTMTWNGNLFDAWLNPYPWNELDPMTGNIWTDEGVVTRINEDVILNNVIGFDVKAWDPGAPVLASPSGQILLPGDPGYIPGLLAGAGYTVVSRGAYVDLNYGCRLGPAGCKALMDSGSVFAGPGVTGLPGLNGYANIGTDPSTTPTVLRSAVYDTWSTHYEQVHDLGDGIVLGNGIATNGFDDDGDGIVDGPSERQYPPPYAAPLRGIQVKIRVFEPDSRQIREVTIVQEFVTK